MERVRVVIEIDMKGERERVRGTNMERVKKQMERRKPRYSRMQHTLSLSLLPLSFNLSSCQPIAVESGWLNTTI